MLDKTNQILTVVNTSIASKIARPLSGFIKDSRDSEAALLQIQEKLESVFRVVEACAISLFATTAIGQVGGSFGINLAQGFNPFVNPTLLNAAIACGVAGAVNAAIFGPRVVDMPTQGGAPSPQRDLSRLERVSNIITAGIGYSMVGAVICGATKAIAGLAAKVAETAPGIGQ